MMRLTGKWAEASRIGLTMVVRFQKALGTATMKEAQFLRAQLVKGIADQAPGGASFAPLSPATLALRKAMGYGGDKALVRSGALQTAISVVKMPGATPKVFVGILRAARTKDGKSLTSIAAIQESGATIQKTERMRRFIMAKLRAAGVTPSTGAKGARAASSVVIIPPRPFIAPVLAKYAQPSDVKRRFYQHLADAMNGDFGRMAAVRI